MSNYYYRTYRGPQTVLHRTTQCRYLQPPKADGQLWRYPLWSVAVADDNQSVRRCRHCGEKTGAHV